ncbi:MAG: transcription factor S [Nitrososphaerota archaeon]|nr:transcription factor S [Nitrososphaerales archaeon]MCX8191714.1 transcription factor S [Nitrososphaerales archaeon]MDW8045258.1 transcription factor S [Nitrososphaerota archaeon]
MKFCPKCGTRLKFKQVKLEGSSFIASTCDRCGFYLPKQKVVERPNSATHAVNLIKVVNDNEAKLQTMPTTTAECPECKNTTAYWWMLQTRSADEAPTQFFRCTRCGYTWRQYS